MKVKYQSLSKSLKILSAIALMALIFSACSSKKTASKPDAYTGATASGVSATATPAQLAATYTGWENLYAPFSMHVTSPLSFSFSGRATMIKDKAINLSLRILGMEVGVLYVDNDSLIAVDKYDKVYVSLPLTSLSAKTPLTLGDIQSILLGQAIYPGQGTLNQIEAVDKLFSRSSIESQSIFTPKKAAKGVTWYLMADNEPCLTQLTVEPDGLSPFNAYFSDFKPTEAGTVAQEMQVDGAIGKKKVEFELKWNMGKAQWNGQRTIAKPDTRGLKPLDTEKLLRTASSQKL